MTALAELFTSKTSEPEETRVTAPQPFTRPGSLWQYVPGIDPAASIGDWALEAQCTAMACAAHVFGLGAGYPTKLLSRKGAPAQQWLDWLTDTASPEDAMRRRLALRLICERATVADADAILEDAQHLHGATTARRR